MVLLSYVTTSALLTTSPPGVQELPSHLLPHRLTEKGPACPVMLLRPLQPSTQPRKPPMLVGSASRAQPHLGQKPKPSSLGQQVSGEAELVSAIVGPCAV